MEVSELLFIIFFEVNVSSLIENKEEEKIGEKKDNCFWIFF